MFVIALDTSVSESTISMSSFKYCFCLGLLFSLILEGGRSVLLFEVHESSPPIFQDFAFSIFICSAFQSLAFSILSSI